MEDIKLNNTAIAHLLNEIGVSADYYFEIQPNSKYFEIDKWKNTIQLLKKTFKISKYLYLFVKCDQKQVFAFYLGKSQKSKFERISQHYEGLKEVHENIQNFDVSNFYFRMYQRFFQENKEFPLYLLVFKWNTVRVINNIFPFPIDCNISNAEFILTSYINSKFKFSNINHDFITRLRWKNLNFDLSDISYNELISIDGNNPVELWNNFMYKWMLLEKNSPLEKEKNSLIHINLFKTKQNSHEVEIDVKRNTKILEKSEEMKKNIQDSVKIVENSYLQYIKKKKLEKQVLFADGLIYMVYVLASDVKKKFEIPEGIDVIPIYIGKTEALGRTGGFSGNLRGVSSGGNLQYFARWGYDSARHIGGLSLQFYNIPNRYPSTNYEHWIDIMFDPEKRAVGIPYLNFPVYFRMKPCFPYNISFNKKMGFFSTEWEGLLITLGRVLFPNMLSNKNGR